MLIRISNKNMIFVDMNMNDDKLNKKEELEKFKVIFDGKTFRIQDPEKARAFYYKGYYGNLQEDGQLILNPVEILLNLERRRMMVLNEKTGKHLEFQDLVKELMHSDPNIWTKFIVYKDLRNRG
ncbi:MAG: hypothetical protein ACXQS8_06090 [Candidatus Helarchaeales archaeon]